jgi:hypothetical protein
MRIQDINSAIIAGNWTNRDLESMIDAVKFARSKLTNQVKFSIKIGDNVNWDSTKTGRNTTGVVMKVAQKYVTVKTVTGLWRVPANMLTKIVDESEYA